MDKVSEFKKTVVKFAEQCTDEVHRNAKDPELDHIFDAKVRVSVRKFNGEEIFFEFDWDFNDPENYGILSGSAPTCKKKEPPPKPSLVDRFLNLFR